MCYENLTAQITVLPYMVCVIIHATISEQRRLQHHHKWSVSSFMPQQPSGVDFRYGVIVYAAINEWCRLWCFHIWFSVIVHAIKSEWHAQITGLVLLFMQMAQITVLPSMICIVHVNSYSIGTVLANSCMATYMHC